MLKSIAVWMGGSFWRWLLVTFIGGMVAHLIVGLAMAVVGAISYLVGMAIGLVIGLFRKRGSRKEAMGSHARRVSVS
jgi:uncharacterized membrane protein